MSPHARDSSPRRPQPLVVPGAVAAIAAAGLAALAVPAAPALAGGPTFSNQFDPLLYNLGSAGRGTVWGDLDDDGDLDLVWMNQGADDPGVIARNDGDGIWSDVTPGPFLDGTVLSSMMVLGDYDRDGDLDIFFGGWNEDATVLRNDGDFVFVPVSIDPRDHRSRTSTVADVDGDGWLEYYIGTQGQSGIGGDKLYSFDGTTWTDASPAHFERPDIGRGVVFADFDDDGDLDVYAAHGNGCPCNWEVIPPEWVPRAQDRLYRNDDGVLVDVTERIIPVMLGNGRGVSVGDWDNDGDLDLAVANLAIQGNVQGEKNIGAFGGRTYLLRNEGDMFFSDGTPEAMVDDENRHRSIALVDWDNDGDLDLQKVGIGTTPSSLWENRGGGDFVEIPAGLHDPSAGGRSAAWADYDGDGDLDCYLTFDQYNRLLRNDLDTGAHWLVVALEGTISNTDAIGARVTVDTASGRQIREVIAGSGYWAGHMHDVHVGLGEDATIDELRVRWPSSGLVSVRRELAADVKRSFVEPTGCTDLLDADDCNENGIRDECDIASGTSTDVNGNGVPDECDPPAPCPDLDADGEVGLNDLVEVLAAWGPCKACDEDLDEDGLVGLSDLLQILSAWGPCPG